MSQQECIEAKEEEIAGFASQISKLQCDLDLATQENGRLAEDSKSFDSSYDSINDNLNRAKEDNKALQARCKIYDTELQGFRNEIDRVKAKAEEDKKSLIKKNDVDQKEKEDIATRCLELENIVKESTEENKELTSLLRQKSSQIEALNQTIDEVEALNQKSLEYDDMVNQCSEVEKELLKTSKH
jgi:chromosome segregation ATPase